MQFILDEAIINQNITQILVGILLFVLIPCIYIIIRSLFNYTTIVFSRNKGNECSLELMYHLLKQKISFFDQENSIELMSNSSRELSQYLNFKISELPQYYVTILISIIIIILLAFYHPIIALLQLFFIPLSLIPIHKFEHKVEEKISNVMEYNAKMNQDKAESFQNILFVKSYQLEEKQVNKIAETNHKIVSIWGKIAVFDSLSGIWMSGFVTSLFTGVSFGLISYFVVSGLHSFSYGEIFSIINYCTLLYTGLCSVLMTRIEIAKMEGQFDKTLDYFNLKKNEESDKKYVSMNDSIKFEDVCFSYHDNKPVLNHFNCEFRFDEWTGIEGKSGIGKSTILKLIEKFYDVNKGIISIDSISIDDIYTDCLRSNMTYIAQKPVLFPTTIRENLLLGNENASEEEMWNILEKVNLKQLIESLPNQLDSDIKEAGKLLSGGQQQRLSIAIGCLRKTKIYLLDEITANLDSENALQVCNLFKEMLDDGCTIISVSHDHSFHRYANHIISL